MATQVINRKFQKLLTGCIGCMICLKSCQYGIAVRPGVTRSCLKVCGMEAGVELHVDESSFRSCELLL